MSTCRKCGTRKWKGDPCPGVACTRPEQTLRTRKNMPISLTSAHGFHAAAAVSRMVATASVR